MKNRKRILLATFFLVYLFGLSLVTSFGFSTSPTYTDPAGDQGAYPDFIDMRQIWIDNNATHIMFKIELGGIWNLSGYAVYIYIATGEIPYDNVIAMNVSQNYGLYFYADTQEINFYHVNNSNSLNSVVSLGMGYYLFSNNNQTLEIGYKLRVYSGGKGNLNLSPGQAIEIRIVCGDDTDYAPDLEKNLISYTLPGGGGGNLILILLIILFPVIGVALGLVIYYRRRDIL